MKFGRKLFGRWLIQLTKRKTCEFYGDSITAGYYADDHTNGWVHIYARRNDIIANNHGISGQSMQGFDASSVATYNSAIHGMLFMALGVNDATAYFYGASSNPTNFQNSYESNMQSIITNKGWPLDRIVCIAPCYVNRVDGIDAIIQDYGARVQTVCTNLGIHFISDYLDFKNYSTPGDLYHAADNLHLSNLGHQFRAGILNKY